MSGHGDEQRLTKQHGGGGAPAVFGLSLPEVHGEVHPLAVLLLHLIAAAHINMTSVTYSEVQCTFCLTTGLTQIYRPSPWFGSGSHPVDRFYGTCDCKRPSPPSGKDTWKVKWASLQENGWIFSRQWETVLTFSDGIPQSLDRALHRSVTLPSLGTTTRYCNTQHQCSFQRVSLNWLITVICFISIYLCGSGLRVRPYQENLHWAVFFHWQG